MRGVVAILALLYKKTSGVDLHATVLMHILIGRVELSTISVRENNKNNKKKSQFVLGMINGGQNCNIMGNHESI